VSFVAFILAHYCDRLARCRQGNWVTPCWAGW